MERDQRVPGGPGGATAAVGVRAAGRRRLAARIRWAAGGARRLGAAVAPLGTRESRHPETVTQWICSLRRRQKSASSVAASAAAVTVSRAVRRRGPVRACHERRPTPAFRALAAGSARSPRVPRHGPARRLRRGPARRLPPAFVRPARATADRRRDRFPLVRRASVPRVPALGRSRPTNTGSVSAAWISFAVQPGNAPLVRIGPVPAIHEPMDRHPGGAPPRGPRGHDHPQLGEAPRLVEDQLAGAHVRRVVHLEHHVRKVVLADDQGLEGCRGTRVGCRYSVSSASIARCARPSASRTSRVTDPYETIGVPRTEAIRSARWGSRREVPS